jgi:hypothetical protein
VTPELARPTDAPALARLRDDAARWLRERGIEQWTPGDLPQERIAEQAAAGEWYWIGGDDPLGAVRVLRRDPDFWAEQPDRPALYVHGLVASRRAPAGTGAALLRWVEELAAMQECAVVRLDCVESNLALSRYYEDLGYVRVGRKAFRSTAVALYEKAVGRE